MSVRTSAALVRLAGWTAVLGSVGYFLSDLIEAVQGGFSTGQLWLTLAAEAVVPVFVVGLALARWPRLGRLGLVGAAVYAYAFVYFTGTVIYALVHHTADFAALSDELGVWMTVHGGLMLLGALGLGSAVLRSGVYPRWTGVALVVGVALVAVGLPDPAGLLAAGIRDLAFAGMGVALLTNDEYDVRAGGTAAQTTRR
jgi:hypothetical protein